MPELPEVETVARDLRPLLVGRSLAGLRRSRKALRQKWDKAWEKRLLGRRVEAVHRRGKWLLLELDGGAVLMVHLGMTGRFTVVAPEAPAEPHTHLVFRLDNAHELRFRDARRFGSVTYFPDRPAWEAFLGGRLGPEPWALEPGEWRGALQRTRRAVKAVLLDQTVVAGVGNIYADEACFEARIDSRRPGNALRPAEADRLLHAVRAVLDRAIEARGSSIRDYVGGSGQPGGYQDRFAVYGRAGEPCPRCGRPIRSVRMGGRSTHYCPRCQK
ncbi:MAG: bifunctional DNA-formamidopyrimidine glycosylase/DNA-(apurinic or apyrimidinic site) lyase [Zavarzinella sp.]|nr:bifunctional DNA-formamidopyrimidine glycosylase/DNA-(apurinic or apyrimidinic site) lyase [Zavarzinella sp.]